MKDKIYYYIDFDDLEIESEEYYCEIDTIRKKSGNFFKTKREAEKAKKLIKKVLNKV